MGRMDRLSRDDNDSNSDQRAGAGSAPPEARRQQVEGTQSGGAGDPEKTGVSGAVKERWERRPLQRRDSDVEFVSEGETQVRAAFVPPDPLLSSYPATLALYRPRAPAPAPAPCPPPGRPRAA